MGGEEPVEPGGRRKRVRASVPYAERTWRKPVLPGVTRQRGWWDYGDGTVGVLVPGTLDPYMAETLEDPANARARGLGALERLWRDAVVVPRGKGHTRELRGSREDLAALGAAVRQMIAVTEAAGADLTHVWQTRLAVEVLGRLDLLGVDRWTWE